jgi:hypothetical protein
LGAYNRCENEKFEFHSTRLEVERIDPGRVRNIRSGSDSRHEVMAVAVDAQDHALAYTHHHHGNDDRSQAENPQGTSPGALTGA